MDGTPVEKEFGGFDQRGPIKLFESVTIQPQDPMKTIEDNPYTTKSTEVYFFMISILYYAFPRVLVLSEINIEAFIK